ncbi:type I restriction-modification enzyme R subunit C-terminal domain-containing protein [Fibrobacter sp. UBA4297]|uniref:type I restriction-modification enzyme R subunit C-terminal domain-containing protein n=1 Tax=Fibrobacter sp. UBA4297 TaxID=1946536 RepID=UPI0025C418DC|nr:type I restriction-modification enzyme R subunit C-terminal domain-containing protein [Fibrobacter sp. UBA4297]
MNPLLKKHKSKIALQRFNQFLDGNVLNSDQLEFLNQILDYVCENGDITTMTVVNDYPFDENLQVFSDKMVPLKNYLENVHNVVNPQMHG